MSRILVIDDDAQIREMLRQMLEREGYEIAEASDGREGLKLYHEEPADLVIIDLIMPGKEGIETIRELKQDVPDVKIIAVSGGGKIAPEEYLYLAGKMGAQRTITKPVEREEMLKAVRELLG